MLSSRKIEISDLIDFLKNNDTQRGEEYCIGYKDQFSEMVKTEADLEKLMDNLSSRKLTIIYTIFKDEIIKLIHTANCFVRLVDFDPYNRTEICNDFVGKLPRLITTKEELVELLQCLNKEQCEIVCTALHRRIVAVVTSADDWIRVWNGITDRNDFFQKFKNLLPKIIKKPSDVETVFRLLTPEQRTEAFELIVEPISDQFKEFREPLTLLEALVFLNPQQCRLLFEKIHDKRPAFFFTIYDFTTFGPRLSREKASVVYNVFKKYLSSLILSRYDFLIVLECLIDEERSIFYMEFRHKLPGMIKDLHSFLMIMRHLSVADRYMFYSDFKEQFSKLTTSALDFANIMEYLSVEERSAVYNEFKGQLRELIKKTSDFQQIIKYLRPEERIACYTEVKDVLTNCIKNSSEFINFFQSANLVDFCKQNFGTQELLFLVTTNDYMSMKEQLLEVVNPESLLLAEIHHMTQALVLEVPEELVNDFQAALINNDIVAIQNTFQSLYPKKNSLGLYVELPYTSSSILPEILKLDPSWKCRLNSALNIESTDLALKMYVETHHIDSSSLHKCFFKLNFCFPKNKKNTTDFILALMNNDKSSIQSTLKALYRSSKVGLTSFFSDRESIKKILSAIQELDTQWRLRLSIALEIKNTDDALKSYIESPLSFQEIYASIRLG